MKRSTRNLLLGVGAVVAVGGIVYMARKEEPKKTKTSDALTPGTSTGPGSSTPGDFSLTGMKVTPKVKTKGAKVIPKVDAKGIPVYPVPTGLDPAALAEAICAGTDGIQAVSNDLVKYTTPSGGVDPSWGLWSWCVGYIPTEYEINNLRKGYYLVVWPMNGQKLVFGPFVQLEKKPRDPGVEGGLTAVLGSSFSEAKKKAVK